MAHTNDVLKKIDDLILQATTERSHYYVKSVLEEAKDEIQMLRLHINSIGGYIVALEDKHNALVDEIEESQK